MSKVKEMVKAMITEEQLKTVQEQQAKLTEGLRTLGVLDVQKQNVHGQIAELSKETISIHFNSSAINTEIESQFIALLDECEFARYAPASNKNAQMDAFLEKAKKIIVEVETALK